MLRTDLIIHLYLSYIWFYSTQERDKSPLWEGIEYGNLIRFSALLKLKHGLRFGYESTGIRDLHTMRTQGIAILDKLNSINVDIIYLIVHHSCEYLDLLYYLYFSNAVI